MLEDFDAIASEAWQRSKTALDRLYDTMVGEELWEDSPYPTTYTIYGRDGQPIACHLCSSTGQWIIEGDEVRRVARVFVCEHEPVDVGRGAIRQVSTVPVNRVAWCEETYTFAR
ncbi:MAG: hypothetical protein M5U01_30685 [Ardenticatenaceae bacterium]|nr:hypothetical protein [Ardenticatenaceae bacterium]HBY94084.1 hypothetical protein [Chloroflexota bacterium]